MKPWWNRKRNHGENTTLAYLEKFQINRSGKNSQNVPSKSQKPREGKSGSSRSQSCFHGLLATICSNLFKNFPDQLHSDSVVDTSGFCRSYTQALPRRIPKIQIVKIFHIIRRPWGRQSEPTDRSTWNKDFIVALLSRYLELIVRSESYLRAWQGWRSGSERRSERSNETWYTFKPIYEVGN